LFIMQAGGPVTREGFATQLSQQFVAVVWIQIVINLIVLESGPLLMLPNGGCLMLKFKPWADGSQTPFINTFAFHRSSLNYFINLSIILLTYLLFY
jgi:hypothetical protein